VSTNYYNPFQTSELYLPRILREEIAALVTTGNKGSSPKLQPFKRYIDFWFFAACLSIHLGENPEELPNKLSDTWKFNDGTVLMNDRNRIELMQIIGIETLKNSDASPQEIVRMFNNYAALGSERIVSDVAKDQETTDPLWSLFNGVQSMI